MTDGVPVRDGAWRFEPVPGWSKIPEGRAFGPTHGGVAIDREGKIYCSTDSAEGIFVFAPDGKVEKTIGKEFTGCHSLLLREEGREEFLYAAHLLGHRVAKLRLDGSAVWTFGAPMESSAYKAAEEFRPTAVALAPDGSLWVADGYGTSLLHAFDWVREYVPRWKYRGSSAGAGDGEGECRSCHGLAIDPRGEKPLLLVCDREHRRLVHFDLDGKFLGVVAAGLRRPSSVAFFGDHVAVAELEGRVTILDRDGAVVTHLGDNPERSEWANFEVPRERWKEGIFTAPHAVCFDRDGNLFVQDWNRSGRLSKLARVGEGTR
ncbi:MAG TPA: NHL repeat-containing protein [Planctomycetota bacterium]|nr:NHL repeat-containing protein [Planctomycetota bacterium]